MNKKYKNLTVEDIRALRTEMYEREKIIGKEAMRKEIKEAGDRVHKKIQELKKKKNKVS